MAAASISIGTLTCLVLIGISIAGNLTQVSAQAISHNEKKTQEQITPISISCTPLVIKNLSSYDGNFIEDGSGREVQNVAAIMLYNSRDSVVPYAFITLYTEHCRYTFNAYMIPPKSSVLVPEENAQKLTETDIVRSFGWTTAKQEIRQHSLSIQEDGMCCLRVTNQSGSKIHNLTIYHRTYISEGDFYMGGKAFETQISYIAPGNTVTIYPDNYASGYSKVVYFE